MGSDTVYKLMQGLTDADFEAQFGTEDQCFAALLTARRASWDALHAATIQTSIFVIGASAAHAAITGGR